MKNALALAAVTVAALLAAACSQGADELLGASKRTDHPIGSGQGAPPPTEETDGADASSNDPVAADDDAGTTPTDAGRDAADAAPEAAAPANAFTGAATYVATTGPSTLNAAHPNGGNPAKLACLGCHGAGGGAPRFFAAGTVFKGATTTPAAQVEIRLRDAAGKAVSAYTDANGNFFVRGTAATAAGITLPAHTGARDGTTTKLMSATITSGDCNSSGCHGGGQGWVHVP